MYIQCIYIYIVGFQLIPNIHVFRNSSLMITPFTDKTNIGNWATPRPPVPPPVSSEVEVSSCHTQGLQSLRAVLCNLQLNRTQLAAWKWRLIIETICNIPNKVAGLVFSTNHKRALGHSCKSSQTIGYAWQMLAKNSPAKNVKKSHSMQQTTQNLVTFWNKLFLMGFSWAAPLAPSTAPSRRSPHTAMTQRLGLFHVWWGPCLLQTLCQRNLRSFTPPSYWPVDGCVQFYSNFKSFVILSFCPKTLL